MPTETHFHIMSLLETVITSQFRTGIFSTVDIYFLDYIQYMDELKGQQNFDNPTKEDGQKWKKLLEENAKYHKTLHFDSDNAKN